MNASAWAELIEELADRLPRLELDDVVILKASGNRYTELFQLKDGLALDAVSNTFLPPDGRLTAEQETEMRTKGWQPPDEPDQPNWWLLFPKWPLHSRDAAWIAELMVSTLRDVYGVADPAEIGVRAFKS